jgi:hypothetical protein
MHCKFCAAHVCSVRMPSHMHDLSSDVSTATHYKRALNIIGPIRRQTFMVLVYPNPVEVGSLKKQHCGLSCSLSHSESAAISKLLCIYHLLLDCLWSVWLFQIQEVHKSCCHIKVAIHEDAPPPIPFIVASRAPLSPSPDTFPISTPKSRMQP